MVRALTKDGWHVIRSMGADPLFFIAPKSRIKRERGPKVNKVYPVFPQIFEHVFEGYLYRLAELTDLDQIVPFVDHLLAGHDFFCPRGQHISYFKYKTILLSFDQAKLIGWAVRQRNGSLIHLLVDPGYRGKGIGSHLLNLLEPTLVRSKSDQSTGDPIKFYEKHGYAKTSDERVGKNKNIDLLSREIQEKKPDDINVKF